MARVILLFETPETMEITMAEGWFYADGEPAPNREAVLKLDSYRGFKDYHEAQVWRV